ncbi:N-acetyltransferase family protein [Limimaricola sp. AA108-03]|uniref:GNAT family N-acetyltransferase n=1 Tax=Limimaricola sp. AA108-03 TaxID=3425945 RepID=UPI003D785D61
MNEDTSALNDTLPDVVSAVRCNVRVEQTLMNTTKISIRQAVSAESDAVAAIARKSRSHFLPYLPDLHSFDDDKKFYRNSVFLECDVWVAIENEHIIGFCAFQKGWVDHLYLLPTHVGRSIGESLLNKAKESHDLLRLWVFQENKRAISFYQRNEFQKISETDGSSNAEKAPDALYEWRRPT